MEFLEIINKVLTRLRENTVSTPFQTQYSRLIASLVNETKKEVEDMPWAWSALRQSISFQTVPFQNTYSLTGLGDRGEIIHLWNEDGMYFLQRVSGDRMRLVKGIGEGEPAHYRITGVDSNLDPVITVWPTPTDIQTIEVYAKIPQAELAEADDKVMVPWWPVYLGALALAVEERGEEGGISVASAFARYKEALTEAIAVDALKFPDELVWTVE